MTCVDWLGDCLRKIAPVSDTTQVHRDRNGVIRVISDQVSYDRLDHRVFEKCPPSRPRHAHLMICQLDVLATIMEQTTRNALKC